MCSNQEEEVVNNMTKGQTKGGKRCHFGEPHRWLFGWYDDNEQFNDVDVKCARCGRIEED